MHGGNTAVMDRTSVPHKGDNIEAERMLGAGEMVVISM
jgi:hypothetical protein